MGNFLNNIAAFLASLFVAANDEARRVRNAFAITIVSVAIVYLTQLIFDSLTLTMVIAIICDVVVVWAWFNVRRLVLVAGLGEALEVLHVTTHPGSPEAIGNTEVPKLNLLFDLYVSTALYAIFWMHVTCFFAPLLSLREYPWFGVFLLFGGTAYLIMYPKGALLRKTLVWGIVIALILMFLRLIPSAGWIKFVGTDPFWVMRTSKADRVLAETISDQKEAEDAQVVIRLEKIREKIRRHEELSADDEKFIKERKGKGLIRETLGGMFTPSANDDVPPPEKSPPPKKEPVEKAMKFPLAFAGGKEAALQHDGIHAQKGGYADFEINFPFREGKGIRYQIVFRIAGNRSAKCYLKIDDRPEVFDFQYGQDPNNPDLVIFFAKTGNGRLGLPNLFHSGKVRFKLWSDDDIVVMSSQVELIYPE